MSVTDTILKSCAGVKVQTVESTNWRHEKTYNDIFVKVGDIVVPHKISSLKSPAPQPKARLLK